MQQQVTPPDVRLDAAAPTRVRGPQVVALPVLAGVVDAGPTLGPGFAELLDEVDTDVFAVLERAGATGRAGEVTELTVGPRRKPANPDLILVLMVGVGAGAPGDLRRAGAALARRTKGVDVVATSLPSVGDDAGLRAFVEGVVLGSFEFSMRSAGPKAQPLASLVVAGDAKQQPVLDRALAVAGAGWRARELATVPSNIKSPQWFVDQAAELADAAGLGLTSLDEHDLERDGFGGIVAVGRASATPPRLLRLDYVPLGVSSRRAKGLPHVVLVGKGITFDTGGLSIKSGENMKNMKRDMTGGAVVLAVLAALRDIGCAVRVTGLVPLAENAVSGDATRPGDVITHYGGRTTEVTNTDAEGRLVLADAIAYAAAELEPDVVVDVATLTGGAKVALGQRLGGIFANDDALHGLIDVAGAAAGEPFWRLPLAEDYREKLHSSVADADNAPGGPPAITAALFLEPFTAGLPWAHLDIASVGDAVEDKWEWTAGPTGFGPRALLYWLELAEPLAGVRRAVRS